MTRRQLQDPVGQPCDCLTCQAAGVTHLSSVRVPADETGRRRWLHGEELRRWWAARDTALTAFDELRRRLTMPGARGRR